MEQMLSNVSETCLEENLQKDAPTADKLGPLDINENFEGAKENVEIVKKSNGWFNFQTDLIWTNIIFLAFLHAVSLYAAFTISFTQNLKTVLWVWAVGLVGGIGVTGGVHRLWTHRAYKAKLPLRIILMLAYYTAGQNKIYDWVRDHRVHHKYTETDADPHNSKRGFFFAHIGWLLMKKRPEVLKQGKLIDMSDVLADPVVRFGDRYFIPLKILCAFVLPTLVPVYLFDETWTRAILTQAFLRYAISINSTWCVNSFAHIWGRKPYDKSISPSENMTVAILSCGEGWHNYHHVFPWDYKAAEFGRYSVNLTTFVIDMFAKIGWAYDLKEPSKEHIKLVVQKRGDGTHPIWSEVPEPSATNY